MIKIKKIIFYLLFLFLSIKLISADIIINEIMYNPEGDDNNKEFIEIYSDEKINLSNFIIADSQSNDTLTLLQYYDSDYYLVTEEGFNFSGIEASVYSVGKTIGNDLDNTGDSLFLYYINGTLVANVSYTDVCESGHSLEYFDEIFYCSFYLGGTPGKPNSNRNQDYSQITINEFLPDPQGDDNAPMPDGEFIELYNDGDEDTDLAGLYFKDSADHRLYITDTTTIDGTIIESKGYLAVYTNGFSGFLNNEGLEEIKLYDPYGNLIDKVSYSHSTESLSWSLVGDIWQYRLPTPNEINPKQDIKTESSFEIEGLEGNEYNNVEFGDIIQVKFHVYKGNTTKSSIKLYAENDKDKISKIAKADLPDKFTNYSLTIPIQIKPNCNEQYEDGDYYIKIGWTSSSKEEDSFRIKVEGINPKNCDGTSIKGKSKKGTLTNQLTESPSTAEPYKDFTVKVELTNNDEEDHSVELYSYVYRGNKCYSTDREANKKSVFIKAGQTKEVELNNIIVEAEPGDYKLKIKVKRDDEKTEKEITQPIKVLAERVEKQETNEKEEKIALKEKDKEDYFTILESTKQPKTIYESTTLKTKKLVVYFFIGLLVVYGALLTFKRQIPSQ